MLRVYSGLDLCPCFLVFFFNLILGCSKMVLWPSLESHLNAHLTIQLICEFHKTYGRTGKSARAYI